MAEGSQYFSQTISEILVANDFDRHNLESQKSPLDRLSEREVLQQVANGNTSAEIARALHLSAKTVETYRSRNMHKLGVSDVPGLVRLAIQMGLVSLT